MSNLEDVCGLIVVVSMLFLRPVSILLWTGFYREDLKLDVFSLLPNLEVVRTCEELADLAILKVIALLE